MCVRCAYEMAGISATRTEVVPVINPVVSVAIFDSDVDVSVPVEAQNLGLGVFDKANTDP